MASLKSFKVQQRQERLSLGPTLGPDDYEVVGQLGHDPVTYRRVYVQCGQGHQVVANALKKFSTGIYER